MFPDFVRPSILNSCCITVEGNKITAKITTNMAYRTNTVHSAVLLWAVILQRNDGRVNGWHEFVCLPVKSRKN